ncbi:MAG: hypothetical protein L3K11_02850 [Thermoplasmata archaeon]|nr:hypothetical protein [Thermoplasmata archaeon]
MPDPVALGYPEATVLVARPFADGREGWAEHAAEEPGAVLVWSGTQFGLTIVFHPSLAAAREARRRLTESSTLSGSVVLTPSLTAGELPVYFDHEGLWANLTGASGTLAYPRGLPRADPPESGAPPLSTPRSRWAARELLSRPFSAAANGRPEHLVGPFGIPSAQRRLIESGVIVHRVLGEPSRMPAFEGRRGGQIVLATGELRDGQSPAALFLALTRDCRVFPFLYAISGRRVLLGAVGESAGPAPPNPAVRPARRPVLATLLAALEEIDLFRDEAAHLRPLLDHRFDRLAPAPRE